MSVSTYLDGLASTLLLSETEKSNVSTSINTLSSRLSSYFSSDMKQNFLFGSYTRTTILPRKADSNSDVDYMIVFDNADRLKPQTFITRLKKFAEKYYSSSEIHQSYPTVVLELNHIKFDLVPAYGDYYSYYIPSPYNSYIEWIGTNPRELNDRVDEKNKNDNYKIKPLIRLVKYWNAANDRVFTSYELEQLLISNIYIYCFSLKDYLFKAFENFNPYSFPEYKKNKIERAQRVIAKVKEYEQSDMPYSAEEEIKNILPSL